MPRAIGSLLLLFTVSFGAFVGCYSSDDARSPGSDSGPVATGGGSDSGADAQAPSIDAAPATEEFECDVDGEPLPNYSTPACWCIYRRCVADGGGSECNDVWLACDTQAIMCRLAPEDPPIPPGAGITERCWCTYLACERRDGECTFERCGDFGL